ncbi:hypothetical protein ACQ4PT_065078 [Festuca glaucescens]
MVLVGEEGCQPTRPFSRDSLPRLAPGTGERSLGFCLAGLFWRAPAARRPEIEPPLDAPFALLDRPDAPPDPTREHAQPAAASNVRSVAPPPPGTAPAAGDLPAPPAVLIAGAPQLFNVMKYQATVSGKRKPAPEAGGGNGIDALPDEVLQHVLSFLPAAEAVQTCVLARRWRSLWKSMPVLRITSEGRTLNRRGVRRLNKFVNHLLLLRDRSAPLHTCEIDLCTFRSQDVPQVNLWIRHALLCQAQTLTVHLSHDNNSFELEDLPLVSPHLTRLELCNVVLNDHILNFSSCPALEELRIESCYTQADMIMSQSLKRLTILDCIFYLTIRARISAPGLVALELTELWGRTPLLESMPSLVTGSIKLADCDDCCGKEDGGSCFSDNDTCEICGASNDGSGDCVILNGLSEAKSLELTAEPSVYIFKRDLIWCPTFSKLKTLLLGEWCMDANLGALMCLLQHTPVLEMLTIQLCQSPSSLMGTEVSYKSTGQPFASNTLKVLEIKCEKIDERVHKILTFLSTNGIHIDQINIQQSVGSSEA